MRERLSAAVDVLAFIVWNVGLIAWRYTRPDTPVKTKPQAPIAEPAAVLPDAA
jgi:hypothetical protein